MLRLFRALVMAAAVLAGLFAAWVGYVYRFTLQHMSLAPGMRVADIGCGSGRLTVQIARSVAPGGEVLAVDPDEEDLERARERVRSVGLGNVRFAQASVGDGKLERDLFDRVLLNTVLGEIEQREAALAEIYRGLKPGGLLYVTEAMPDPHRQNPERIRELARGAGFVERACFGNPVLFTMSFEKPRGQ